MGTAVRRSTITSQPDFQAMAQQLGYDPNHLTGVQYVNVAYHLDPNSPAAVQALQSGTGAVDDSGNIVDHTGSFGNWLASHPWIFALPVIAAGGAEVLGGMGAGGAGTGAADAAAGTGELGANGADFSTGFNLAGAGGGAGTGTAAGEGSLWGIPKADLVLGGADIAAKSLASAFAPTPYQKRTSYAGTSADPVQYMTDLKGKLDDLFASATQHLTTPVRSQVDFSATQPQPLGSFGVPTPPAAAGPTRMAFTPPGGTVPPVLGSRPNPNAGNPDATSGQAAAKLLHTALSGGG